MSEDRTFFGQKRWSIFGLFFVVVILSVWEERALTHLNIIRLSSSSSSYLRSSEPQTIDLILTTTINPEKTVVNTKPFYKEPNFAML